MAPAAAAASVDTTPPTISAVQITAVTTSGATVTWTTDEPSDSQVEYGPTAAYGSFTPLNAALVTTHTVTLTGLDDTTDYRFRVRSRDAAGNLSVAEEPTVAPYAVSWNTTTVANGPHTLVAIARNAAGETTTSAAVTFTVNNDPSSAPVISPVKTSRVRLSSATLKWTTDQAADTQVEFGTTTAYGTTVAESALVTSHASTLTGLTPDTVYHYRVKARNAGGKQTASADQTFRTARISVNRKNLYFGATPVNGAAPGGPSARVTPGQTVTVNLVGGDGDWIATADRPWIKISPASGDATGSFTVTLTSAGPAADSGMITVRPADGTAGAETIPVLYTLFAAPAPPAGSIDTPAQNAANVMGSLAVTGWAVHDIGISSVQIWRDPVPGEAPNQLVFVGDATNVDGARPDVESAFAKPFNYQAGWGLMVLTNMLPNRGNGKFTLHAVAVATDGSRTTIGSRTITCDNAHANRPFGAIDTPAPGATISGSSYVNFGWALTANPAAIPPDGSTLRVFVDGLHVASPSYNHFRNDLATLFPGLANSNGPVGIAVLDTTTLANGVHTIAWVVSDTLGRAEGIGSRFFTVLNTATPPAVTAPHGADGQADSDLGRALNAADGSAAAATVRHGYDEPGEVAFADGSGVLNVTTHELERVQIALSDAALDTGSHRAYLVRDGRLASLPIGSSIDSATGVFTWQPGPGFVGEYELAFSRTVSGVTKWTRVRVTIAPAAFDDARHDHRERSRPRGGAF